MDSAEDAARDGTGGDGITRDSSEPRHVPLAGAHNVRDLGGLPTRDGRRTVRGRIYRGEFLGSPETITDPALHALGLRTVVDLRRHGEVAHEQVPWGDHEITLHHVPMRLDRGTTWHAGYHRYLVDGPDRVAGVVRLLVAAAHHPALFHCAAGKDRTGVIAALLLDTLGVTRDAIIDDYALTNLGLAPILDRLSAQEPYLAQLAGTSHEEHRPRPEIMAGFLAWLDDGWCGARGWLLANGVTDAEIADYERVMLEPSS